ncbi:MAG: protein-disulfide isomerase [Myxococcota bacterium]|jgi:protein-disulfide isomerase
METWPNDVRIVFKHNALPFHKRALPAAIASMAAHKQGKFWEYHDQMFANQRKLEDTDLEGYATAVGLDMAKWKADLKDADIEKKIKEDMDFASTVNARGTPNFFINGRNVRGAVPYESFETVIKEEIEKAKKLVAAGTPRDAVYAQIIANGKTFEPLDPKVNTFSDVDSPFLGNPKGDIVIVEASDFQ